LPQLAVAVVAAVMVLVPTSLEAQTTGQLLVERRLEYSAALDEHEAARSAFEVVERRFAAALSEVDAARRSGDEDALAQALSVAQERSLPVRDRGNRVTEASERLEEARLALVGVLTARLTELVARMSTATGEEADQLDALWRDYNNELEALESVGDNPFRLDPVVLPEVTFDQRDLPEEREAKAQLLERYAAMADSAIESYDRQIAGLEDRLRQERQRQDFLARTGRFGDTPPVVPARPGGEPPVQAADSTGAPVRPASLQERIEELRAYQETFVTYRDQLLIRAQLFRRTPRSRA
jgi:hypothetical protein